MLKKKLLGLVVVVTLLFAGYGNSATDQALNTGATSESTEVVADQDDTTEIEPEAVPTYASVNRENSSATKKTASSKKSTTKKTIKSSSKKSTSSSKSASSSNSGTVSAASIPTYTDSAYTTINNNVPGFSANDKIRTDTFETYSKLDFLGRCGVAYANICKELMPTEERGAIGSVKPSGWHTVKYAGVVDGNYLYNRCHLIGYQLAGENANTKNLITGTRYLNVEGMLQFEDKVADYVEETYNHVLYRVTPVFEGNNLVASGVQIEAYSVEDSGAGICFNVYCYNVQPGITIDYATGDSALSGEEIKESTKTKSASGDSKTTTKAKTEERASEPATQTPAENNSSEPEVTVPADTTTDTLFVKLVVSKSDVYGYCIPTSKGLVA